MFVSDIVVLTLNVWSIPFVSKNREERILAIASELSSGKYDIVSLQEVWSQKDVETIKATTASVLPYSHYFFSGVMGAGLLVLSKYPIVSTLFHPWSVNGYFHRIQHADWFGGKGVGLCKILIGDRIVHLYNAHLHAEYNNENDEYKTHRVIQAFDTAQFIEATRADSMLQILAGDLNTQPDDICYKVLLYTSRMRDCCSSNTIATNECYRNSYTAKRTLEKNPAGIRIDHIFVRSSSDIDATVDDYSLPFPDRVPGHKFSFSDHEAVLARLKITSRLNFSNNHRTSDPETTIRCRDVTAAAISSDGSGLNGESSNCAAAANTPQLSNGHSGHSDSDDGLTNQLAALHEAIALCDASFQQLAVDRILYYGTVVCSIILLVALAELSVPSGFKTVFLLLKFIIFGIIIFSLFMGSIWNFMERNGILSGKKSMEILLQSAEKIDMNIK